MTLPEIKQGHEQDINFYEVSSKSHEMRAWNIAKPILNREAFLIQLVEEAVPFVKHDKLCGIVGGYGECTCGLQEWLDKVRGE